MKINYAKTGKRLGLAIGGDMGGQYERALVNAGVGKRDASTIGRGVDYTYGAATLGVAPVSKMAIDEARSREAQRKKKKKKKKKQKFM